MNKRTLILIFVAALLLLPTGSAIRAFAINKYSVLAGEAGVAYSVAFIKDIQPQPLPVPTPVPIITTCDKCNGTKKYKPDGKIEQPCPCGANCKCSGSALKLHKQIIVVTEPKTCPPCAQQDQHVFPALKEMKWKFGENEQIHVIGLDKATELGYNITSLPTNLLIEDGKVVAKYEGFLSGYGFGKLWAGKTDKTGKLIVEQKDITLYEYKAK